MLLPNGHALPVVLLANKCDLPDVVIDEEALNKFVIENGFIGWFETSAKSNHKIDIAAKFLVENILSHTDIFEDKQKKRDELGQSNALKPTVVKPGEPDYKNESGGCC